MREETLVKHDGIFRRQISLFEGVALITSGTIGAGILGLPYVVAQAGLGIGLLYILVIGFLTMGLNLMLGRIAVWSGAPLQLAGLAGRYFGRIGKALMTAISYTMAMGVLVIYLIGEGQTLAALFGGEPFRWSLIFFAIASILVIFGMRTVKRAELILSLGILLVVLAFAAGSVPAIEFVHWQHLNFFNLFAPYGVMIFAFHGVTSIPEAYSILRDREQTFRKAIMIATSVVMVVYTIFTATVIGVTGLATTEIATIGLGQTLGPIIFFLGNIFALLTMGTSFLMAGVSLRDSLCWDFHVPTGLAAFLVLGAPLFVYLSGVRNFIATIEVVGGVFMTIEIGFIILMYLRARRAHRQALPMVLSTSAVQVFDQAVKIRYDQKPRRTENLRKK